jgi:hypothetical protein
VLAVEVRVEGVVQERAAEVKASGAGEHEREFAHGTSLCPHSDETKKTVESIEDTFPPSAPPTV